MTLSDDEISALEVVRTFRNVSPSEDESTPRSIVIDAMLRLFPPGHDAEITPERLVACGGQQYGAVMSWYCRIQDIHRRFGVHCWKSIVSDGKLEWEVDGRMLGCPLRPRNMGEVWRMLDRCGIQNTRGDE